MQQVLGFLGESATLSPDGMTSQNFTSIKWLIWSNDTWIATYIRGETKTDHFWRYRGRLHLDTSSGHLKISNLTRADAMQYVMEMAFPENIEELYRVDLRVEERLPPPTMEIFSRLDRGSCQVHLRCSSPSPSVAFTWSIEPRTTWTEAKSKDSYHAFLWASTEPYREARFTCNTSSLLGSTSRTLVHTCNDIEMFCSRRNLMTSSSSGDLHHEEGSLKALGWMVQ
ncbi:unnamed protein product [Merluccius merluccius]